MRYSALFASTQREISSDEVAVNARLLLRAGLIDKLMAGSYSLLPLGLRSIQKIQNVVRTKMNHIDAQEILMPLLHPKSIWNETGRWESAADVMYRFEKDEKEYALSFTHEEIIIDLIRKHASSYKNYPVKLYQFSTKFRNELRAKSGILRGREFIMKDLYSLHATEEELNDYYWKVAAAYTELFKSFSLETKIVEAAGGVFTKNITHEFQVLTDIGEDEIFFCDLCDFAQNKEITKVKKGGQCPKCKGTIEVANGIEVGNIFNLGDYYSKKMNLTVTDKNGEKKYPYFASYGIGITRLLGTIVEVHHDDKGIIWPDSVAPYGVWLMGVGNEKVQKAAKTVYRQLKEKKMEVLFDDRADVSTGVRFADCDLIGLPYRIVISEKTLEKGKDMVELKKRSEKTAEIMSLEKAIDIVEAPSKTD